MRFRVTNLVDENLPLTQFKQFWQLVSRCWSFLLPRWDGGTFKIQVNGRFLLFGWVTLYEETGREQEGGRVCLKGLRGCPVVSVLFK